PAQAQRRHDTLSQVPIFELPAPLFRGSGAFGDFDGDQAADLAVADALPVQGATYRYRIGVRLTAQSNTAFDVETRIAGGLRVSALDVDGDRDIDLVITSRFGRQPIGVWINDGQGAFCPGDLAAYSNSIWQQSDRFFEPPKQRLGQAVPFTCSA